jgi:hypothetical protein
MKRSPGSSEQRRNADRIIDTAEGVLIALRRYSLNQAFLDLAHTAKQHGVATVTLADALVAVTQNQFTTDCDPHAMRVVDETWGTLLHRGLAVTPSALSTEARSSDPPVSIRSEASRDGQRESLPAPAQDAAEFRGDDDAALAP